MRGDLYMLGTAAAAVVCCLGLSLLVAVGGTALLGFAGVAVPAAALIGIGGWTAWYLGRRSQSRERGSCSAPDRTAARSICRASTRLRASGFVHTWLRRAWESASDTGRCASFGSAINMNFPRGQMWSASRCMANPPPASAGMVNSL